MTVEVQTNVNVWLANGTTETFPFQFPVLKAEHLIVSVRDITSGVETVIPANQYVIAGLGAPTGNITFTTGPVAAQHQVILLRKVPYTQPLDLINQSGFYPATIETQLDLTIMQLQQLNEAVGRTISVPVGEPGITLPAIDQREGFFPVFLPDGSIGLSSGTGADAGLRQDLGAPSGGSLVGTPDNGNAADAIMAAASPIALAASSKALAEDTTIRTANGHLYTVLPSDAVDYDLETAGGAKLAVVPVANSVALSAFGADPSGVTGSADALVKAWNATPEGGTLVIDGDYKIEKTVTLPDRNIDVLCRGSLIVDPGAWTAIYIEKLPDFELPGTDLIAPVKGDAKLVWDTGKTPDALANEYFVVLESTEELITRVGNAAYTPYTKNEIHSISVDDWTLFDPILYDYTDLSKLTVRLFKKGRQRDWSSLRIVAAADATPDSRSLLYLEGLSNINLRSPVVDASEANGAGNGLAMHRSCHLNLDSPRIFGFNVVGVDSYKMLNSLSAHVTINRYVSESEPAPAGTRISRCYVARHGNQVRFNDCTVSGIDDHYGSNYSIRGGSISGAGIDWAGRNLSIVDVDAVGLAAGLFVLRTDTPFCEGTLEIRDIRLSADSMLVDNRSITVVDPLARTTDYKFFDRVKIGNIRVGEGDQTPTQYLNLRGMTNRSWFTSHTTELIEIDDVQINPQRTGAGQATVMLGNFDFDRMRVSRFGKVTAAVAYIGDIRFFTGTQPAAMVFEAIDCPALTIDYFGSTNGQKLILRNVTIDGQGASLLLNPAISSTIEMENVRFNKTITANAPTATYTLDMTNVRFNVLPSTGFSGAISIARGIGSAMAAGLTVPAAFTNKMLSYLNSASWKEA